MTTSVKQAIEDLHEMTTKVEIRTERFLLRELTEGDVTQRYLDWLSDPESGRFIAAAATVRKLSDLRQYVRERTGQSNILFLGIFEKASGLHIGNIKYEPVNSDSGCAIMGMLIGDPAYRNKGGGGGGSPCQRRVAQGTPKHQRDRAGCQQGQSCGREGIREGWVCRGQYSPYSKAHGRGDHHGLAS